MNTGLLWTAIGSITGVMALVLVAWQVRLQITERRERRGSHSSAAKSSEFATDGLPVAVPLGRLPGEVRGRDSLLSELQDSLVARPRGPGRTWVLAGMGGL